MVSLLALPIDVTSLEKAGRTVLVILIKETLIKEIKIYKDGSSDVINNNTEHTAWKNYIFKHRLRPKNKTNFDLQEFDIIYPINNNGGSTARTPPAAAANIVVLNNFTDRGAYTLNNKLC